MGRIESLADLYERQVAAPWPRTLAGAQRVVLVVYDRDLERAFRAKKDEFRLRTERAGRGWVEVDLTRTFPEWMAAQDYREAFFEEPGDLTMKLEAEFLESVAAPLRQRLRAEGEDTVVALTGIASLYGFLHVSDLVRSVEPDIRGRLVVFFPGTRDANNYRLLDARDGWNYLAQGISLASLGGAP